MPRAATRWTCPKCRRTFARPGQDHACRRAQDQTVALQGRSQELVRTYHALERALQSFGEHEVFATGRSVLFRTVRIFADAVVMTDAIRIAIHLDRQVEDPLFIKCVSDGRKVTHVAKLRTTQDVQHVLGYLSEAYTFSLR
jgi:hypothetical protein